MSGPRSVRVYVPIPMYSCVLRINYTNLDIRILHTLMYQIDLCYTDSDICDLRVYELQMLDEGMSRPRHPIFTPQTFRSVVGIESNEFILQNSFI